MDRKESDMHDIDYSQLDINCRLSAIDLTFPQLLIAIMWNEPDQAYNWASIIAHHANEIHPEWRE